MIRRLALVLSLVSWVACDKGPPKTAAPSSAAAAPAPVAPAAKGKSFGAGVKLSEATAIDAILANPKDFDGKTVRVEGMVTDVCPKRGCWMQLAGDKPGQKLKFKVTDGEMVFPMDAKGKRVIAEGVIAARDLSLEETQAYAESQSKEYGTPYDPASITEPKTLVQIDGTGAQLVD